MKAFIEEIGNKLGFSRRDLIEKDILLHGLLRYLSQNSFFKDNFLFKGGTCLIKSYLDYYRFSEDIDFTWYNQDIFIDHSQKWIRRFLSGIIEEIGLFLEESNMDFNMNKSNRNYVELTGSNKTVTFKLWYNSEVLGYKSFIKIQINFVEKILFPPVERKMRSLLSREKLREVEEFFPGEFREYQEDVSLLAYDIREILCEKIRSILTRRESKARDFIDIYLISKKYGLKITDLKQSILDKTRFILRLYNRYRENLKNKRGLLKEKKLFRWSEEEYLLLREIDKRDLYEFINSINEDLINILYELEVF